MQICADENLNGGDNDNITGKVTFCNARGTSLIDYVLVENKYKKYAVKVLEILMSIRTIHLFILR